MRFMHRLPDSHGVLSKVASLVAKSRTLERSPVHKTILVRFLPYIIVSSVDASINL